MNINDDSLNIPPSFLCFIISILLFFIPVYISSITGFFVVNKYKKDKNIKIFGIYDGNFNHIFYIIVTITSSTFLFFCNIIIGIITLLILISILFIIKHFINKQIIQSIYFSWIPHSPAIVIFESKMATQLLSPINKIWGIITMVFSIVCIIISGILI
jgi:hypothetical protein